MDAIRLPEMRDWGLMMMEREAFRAAASKGGPRMIRLRGDDRGPGRLSLCRQSEPMQIFVVLL